MSHGHMTRREWLAGLVAAGVLTACRARGEAAPAPEPAAPEPPGAAPAEVPAAPEAGAPAAPTPEPPPAAQVAAPAVTVTLVHDTICPWCRIGHHRLKLALAQVPDLAVRVDYQPFLLEPDTPPEGHDMRARLAAKYGPERIAEMFDRVTRIGAADGLTFAFDKIRRSPNTVASHVLIGAAPDAVRAAVVDAIHAAYFERGEDTGDRAVLARLAAEAGWDAAAARAALEDAEAARRTRDAALAASARGVRGVPHFTITGRPDATPRFLSGAQPVQALVEALRAVA